MPKSCFYTTTFDDGESHVSSHGEVMRYRADANSMNDRYLSQIVNGRGERCVGMFVIMGVEVHGEW
jgi:hypothetical protein